MPNSTVLEMTGIDIPDDAIRGLRATLRPIVSGSLEYDVNGNLVDMTLPTHRKYSLSLECTDFDAPELTGVYRGHEVTVKILPGHGVVEGTDNEPITLQMMVDDWETGVEELEADTAWTMSLLQK